jgi:hypothetical protein
MNVVIYPSPNKELNINEKMFCTPPLELTYFKFIEDTTIISLEQTIQEFTVQLKPINSITILLDNYATFIINNLECILSNKHITFYINENDIHYLSSKPKTFDRYMRFRNKLIDNDHIYILAFYWYFYKKLYNIKPSNNICFPKFIVNINLNINNTPIMKVVLSGAISKQYPMRKHIRSLNHPSVKMISHADNIRGDDYYLFLNKHICAFSCCSNNSTPYIVNKFFEIPASGCLLLAYDEFIKEPLKEIGFIDGENYISCTKNNVAEKIEYICDENNIDIINKIRTCGYNLVKNNHTQMNMYELLITLIEKSKNK